MDSADTGRVNRVAMVAKKRTKITAPIAAPTVRVTVGLPCAHIPRRWEVQGKGYAAAAPRRNSLWLLGMCRKRRFISAVADRSVSGTRSRIRRVRAWHQHAARAPSTPHAPHRTRNRGSHPSNSSQKSWVLSRSAGVDMRGLLRGTLRLPRSRPGASAICRNSPKSSHTASQRAHVSITTLPGP